MNPVLRVQGWIGSRILLLTTAAVPLALAALTDDLRVRRQLAAARRDPLTGLLCRDSYTARARRLLARHGDDTVVVLVDLDHFKQINDTMGHPAGDTVLAATAARLTAWAGTHAAAGRLGGDELAVVLELSADRLEQRLVQLVHMLHAPVVLVGGHTVDVAASVGAATPQAVGSRELAVLQRAADAALYDGKHSGRAAVATAAHATVPSVNGRRAGRPGTSLWGRAA
ncbi:GGDEF domain-containing protein [Streptomyces longwoodensis]|uniref:GGDEF domain-containing protein n=1 Tax=Streptomyces longwoodensis TaxID=68231 RepID=UPI0037AEAE6E